MVGASVVGVADGGLHGEVLDAPLLDGGVVGDVDFDAEGVGVVVGNLVHDLVLKDFVVDELDVGYLHAGEDGVALEAAVVVPSGEVGIVE